MKNRNIGNAHIQPGDTVKVDHNITTFMVSIRTMSNVGTETIKDLIEKNRSGQHPPNRQTEFCPQTIVNSVVGAGTKGALPTPLVPFNTRSSLVTI